MFNRYGLVLGVLWLVTSVSLAGEAPKAPKITFLRIESAPPGAMVFLDGRYVGLTPVRLPKSDQRRYSLKLTKAGFQAWRKAVEPSAEDLLVEAKLARVSKGRLIITSKPTGADVFLDGDPVGRTPLTLEDVEATEHMLRIQRTNFILWQGEIEVAPDGNTTIHRTLKSRLVSHYVRAIEEDPSKLSNYVELIGECLALEQFDLSQDVFLMAVELLSKKEGTAWLRDRDQRRNFALLRARNSKLHWEQASPFIAGRAARLVGRSARLSPLAELALSRMPPRVAVSALLRVLAEHDSQVRRQLAPEVPPTREEEPVGALIGAVKELRHLLTLARGGTTPASALLKRYDELIVRYPVFTQERLVVAALTRPALDRIRLTNGDSLSGQLLRLDPKEGAVIGAEFMGGELRLPIGELASIHFAAATPPRRGQDRLLLGQGDVLWGQLTGVEGDRVRFRPFGGEPVLIAKTWIKALVFGTGKLPSSERIDQDRLFFRNGDRLSGRLVGITKDQLLLSRGEQTLKFSKPLVAAVGFASAKPPAAKRPPAEAVLATVSVTGAGAVSGRLVSVDAETVRLVTPYALLALPRTAVEHLTVAAGGGTWRTLFNGADLKGWSPTSEGWKVEDNRITAAKGAYSALIYTQEEFNDFVVEYRTQSQAKDVTSYSCVAFGCRGANYRQAYHIVFSNSGLYVRRRGSYLPQEGKPTARRLEAGRPYHIRIVKAGAKIQVFVDDQLTATVTDPEPLPGGRFALYNIGRPVQFWDIRVQAKK